MKTETIDPSALCWATFNCFELRLPGQCVLDCAHSGQCDDDVEAWKPKIIAQIESDNFPNRPTPEAIREELSEYGAWDEEELADDDANMDRLIWSAANNIREDDERDCSEPIQPITHITA